MIATFHSPSLSILQHVVEKMARVSTLGGMCGGVDTCLALAIFGTTAIFAYRWRMNFFPKLSDKVLTITH